MTSTSPTSTIDMSVSTCQSSDQGIAKARVRVGGDVWLSAGTVVTRGVVIGGAPSSGANSVVTRDLPAYSVAVWCAGSCDPTATPLRFVM